MQVWAPRAYLQSQEFSSPRPPFLFLPPGSWDRGRAWVPPDHSFGTLSFCLRSAGFPRCRQACWSLLSWCSFEDLMYLLYFYIICGFRRRFLCHLSCLNLLFLLKLKRKTQNCFCTITDAKDRVWMPDAMNLTYCGFRILGHLSPSLTERVVFLLHCRRV